MWIVLVFSRELPLTYVVCISVLPSRPHQKPQYSCLFNFHILLDSVSRILRPSFWEQLMISLLSWMCLRRTQVVGAKYLLSEKELPLPGPSGKPKSPWVISESAPAAQHRLILEPRMLCVSLASFIQRVKKSKNLNRNPEALACCIPIAFISEEGRSARTETTAAQKVLQQQACSIQCPRLALTPKQLLYAPWRLFHERLSGVVQPTSSLGSMKRRGGRKDRNQRTPRGAQPLHSCWHHHQEPGTGETFLPGLAQGTNTPCIKASCPHCWAAVAYMHIQILLPVHCYSQEGL